jgi:hypothetical protein
MVDQSCRYYSDKLKEIMNNIEKDKPANGSIVRHAVGYIDCEGNYEERRKLKKFRDELLYLAGNETMTENLIKGGNNHEMISVIKINKTNLMDLLN